MIAMSIAALLLAAGDPATEAEAALCAKSAQVMEVSTTTGEFATSQAPLFVEIRKTSHALLDRYSSRRTGPGAEAFDQLGRAEFNRKFSGDSPMRDVWAVVQACAASGRPG